MASKNQVRLEAVAEVQKARAEILKLVEVVNQLAAAVGKTTDAKFNVDADGAIKQLDQLEKQLVQTSSEASKAATETVAAEATATAAVEGASKKQIDAIIKKDAAAERAHVKESVRLATRKSELAKAVAAEIAAAEKEAAAVIAAEGRKSAALERAKIQAGVRLAVAQDRARKSAEAAEAASRREIEAAHAAAIAYDRKRTKLIQAQEAQDAFAASARNAARSVQAFFASIVVQKLQQFIGAIINSAAAFESYRNTIIAAVGSTEAADAAIAHLRETANIFGVSFETLLQRFGRFKVAADSVGFSVEQTETIFDGFVAVSRALGNTNEQTERTFVALEQIMSKGVVQSEELKQQLGDSLVGAYNKLGAAMGLSGLEFEKQLKNNEIMAKKAIPQLVAAYLELSGPAIQRNLSSINSEIERSKTALFDAKVEAGNAAAGEFKNLLQTLQVIGTSGSLSFQNIGSASGEVLRIVRDLVVSLDSLLRLDVGDLGKTLLASFVDAGRAALGVYAAIGEKAVFVYTLIATRSKETAAIAAKAFKEATDEQLSALDILADGFRENTSIAKRQAELRVEFERKATDEVIALQERIAALVEQARLDELNGIKTLTKEELNELKKREQAFEAFFAKIADLSLKQPKVNLPDAPSGPDIGSPSGEFVSDDQIAKVNKADTQIQKLRDTLAELIAKKKELEEDAYVTGGQLKAVQELEEKILKTEQAIRRASEAASASLLAKQLEEQEKAAAKLQAQMESYAAKVKAALVDLVRDNDAFRDSFTRLDEGSQIAVEALVGHLERAAEAGRVTEADFQNFLSGIATIFGQAGVIGQEFAAGLQASFGQGQASVVGLLQSLAAIGPTALAGAEGMSAATATVVANADEQKIAVQSVGTVSAEAFLAASDAAKASSDEITASFEGAADNAAKAQVRMVDAVARGAGDSVAAITNTIDFASGKVDDFGGLVETIGEKGERSFTMVGDAAKAAGDEVANTINVATDATGKLTVSNEKIEQAGDAAVAAFKEATKEVGAAVGEIGKVDTATKGAKTSSEGLAKAAASTKKSAEDTPAAIDKVSASVALLDGKLAGVEAKLQSCLTIALQLEQCMNRIAQ